VCRTIWTMLYSSPHRRPASNIIIFNFFFCRTIWTMLYSSPHRRPASRPMPPPLCSHPSAASRRGRHPRYLFLLSLPLHTHTHLSIYMCHADRNRQTDRQTYYSVKRDLLQCQKRPPVVSKETHRQTHRQADSGGIVVSVYGIIPAVWRRCVWWGSGLSLYIKSLLTLY